MPTNRTPIVRRSTATISPRALEAFRRLVALESQCTCPPDRQPVCAACDEWWRMQSVIGRELHLRPWHFPAVEYEGMADWPPNEAARALWRLFEQAASEPEPRRGRKRARREPESVV